MSDGKLKKWELAMLLSICFTLLFGLFFGETECCAWWGTVYPELTPAGSTEVFSAQAGAAVPVEIRFRLLEWLAERFG